MNIQDELATFLASSQGIRHTRNHDPDLRRRNVAIIHDHFALGPVPHFWPTLHDLAERHNIGSIERVRQIILSNYGARLGGRQLPMASVAASFLALKDQWRESEYLAQLQTHGLISPLSDVAGLLKYFRSQSLATEFDLYLPDLRTANRDNYFDYDDRLIIRRAIVEDLQHDLATAYSVARHSGLADLSSVQKIRPSTNVENLRDVIRLQKGSWHHVRRGKFWYAFEDRESTILNDTSKTFALTSTCPIDVLADILATSLKRRPARFGYPDAPIVAAWINASRHFTVEDGLATWNGPVAVLTDLEKAVAQLLRGNGRKSARFLAKELAQQGFNQSAVAHVLLRGPIVYVDRSAGRTRYQFTLVSDVTAGPSIDSHRTRRTSMKAGLATGSGSPGMAAAQSADRHAAELPPSSPLLFATPDAV